MSRLIVLAAIFLGVASANVIELPLYGQCGGAGANCSSISGAVCKDEAWPNTRCKEGQCYRQNEFYYQCLTSPPTASPAVTASPVVASPRPAASPAVAASPKPTTCDTGLYTQCGGQGAYCSTQACGQCVDKEWATCTVGTCQRQNAYYWQCLDTPAQHASPHVTVPASPKIAPSPTPKPSPAPQSCGVPLYGQCGGSGAYCSTQACGVCEDREWAPCNAGTCQRQAGAHGFYWQCL